MKNYIIYARKSSEADDKQVQSIEDQLNYCKKRINSSEGNLIATFTEEKSAKKPGIRSAFYEMLELIEKTENVILVSWKLNRLSRNPIDSGTIQYALQNDKIFSILTSDREYHKEDSGLMFSVESGMGNQFIIDLSKDTKRGMRGKADKGGWNGPAPLGYLNNRLDKTIIIDPDRFLTIRRMWDLLLKEKYSLSFIADIANTEWGFRTIRKQKMGGRPLAISVLHRIFTNPFYAGMIRFKGQIIKGNHEPMITLEEFNEAQKIVGTNHRQKERPSKNEFPFTGYIKCACCGCSIVAEKKIKKLKTRNIEYTYYHCSHKKDTFEWKCSERSSIQENNLDKQILDILEKIEMIPDFVIWAKGVLHRLHGDESRKMESTFELVNKEIIDQKRRLSKLFDLLINETITEKEYKEKKYLIETEISVLEGKRNSSGNQEKNWLLIMEEALDFVKSARIQFSIGTIEKKKRIFRALGSNLLLKDGQLMLELNSWFYPFTKIQKGESSPLSRLEPHKKSISLRETNAFDDENSKWLPVLEEVRTNILEYQGNIVIPSLK